MTVRPSKGLTSVLCSLALAVACSTAVSTAQAAPLKIGASFQEINNPYFVTMKDALQDASKSVGAELLAAIESSGMDVKLRACRRCSSDSGTRAARLTRRHACVRASGQAGRQLRNSACSG